MSLLDKLQWAGIWLLLAVPPAVLSWAVMGLAERQLVARGMGRTNYQGEIIPCGMGVVFVAFGLPIAALAAVHTVAGWGLFVVIAGFGILGFLDDRYGARGIGGFKGHFRALLKEHRLTTGALKAIGGGVFSLLAGWLALQANPRFWLGFGFEVGVREVVLTVLINAGLIALSANAVNLLDTRPGRALKVWGTALALFLAFSLLHEPLAYWSFWFVIVAVGGVAAVYFWRDLGARSMMGDVGSNTLGAALGYACAAADLTPWGKIGMLAVLLAFNLFCEKYSVSRLLDKRRNA